MSAYRCVLSVSPVHQSFCLVLSLALSTTGSLLCSLGSLIIRIFKQIIVTEAFLFEQLLDFLICFVKPVLVFSGRLANNFSRGLLQYGLHLPPLFLRLCSCHTMKSYHQLDLEIVFHPWVTKFVHLQFLRLGTFPPGRRLEGEGDFASYQPVISVAVCTGHHSGV